MKYDLIPAAGHFYKVNMHCHTNISDGKQSPEEVKEWYKAHGYSAVCYTDHEVLIGHEDLCDDTFIALHGYEVAIKQDLSRPTATFMPVYHFNFVAEDQKNRIPPRYFVNNPSMPGDSRRWAQEHGTYDPNDTIETTKYDKEWINDYLKGVSEKGFLVTYNHPQWSLQNWSDYVGLEHLHAVEIINGGCRFLNDNTSLPYEQMLRSGMRVVANGGDDNHNTGGCGHGWTMIKAPELSYQALIEAYKKGDCYASEGPEILELYIEDGQIVIKASPAVSICLFSEGRCCYVKADEKNLVTEARFAYNPQSFGSFFRIEVRDATGRKAFSSPYYTAVISL